MFNLPGCCHLGAEIKKELSALSGLLVDIPQEDDLKVSLEKNQKRLKALALKRPCLQSYQLLFALASAIALMS